MSSTTPRRLAAAIATAGAGAIALGTTAIPSSAQEIQPDAVELGDFQLGYTQAVDPTLPGPERLAQHQDATLQTAAERSGISLSQVKKLVENDQAIVSPAGALSFTDHFDVPDGDAPQDDAAPAGDVPGDPAGGSKPGAPYTVYLDFDGATLENTEWNRANGADVIELEANAAASDEDYVYQVWARVAEDYAPFNINVTTADPGADALHKTSEDDAEYGMTAVITDSTELSDGGQASGKAWLGGFGSEFLSPALVFAPVARDSNPADVGNITSHEVGHTFNLNHDGIGDDEYYGDTQPADPQTLWGPIMGAPWATPLSHWSPGDYADATNPEQDDLAEISATGTVNRYFVLYTQSGDFWVDPYCTDADDANNPAPGDQVWETNAQGGCEPTGDPLEIEFSYSGRAAHGEDDHGNGLDAATGLDNASGEFEAGGIVEAADDRDVFALVTSGGDVELSATPATVGANLDIHLEVFDAEGTLVAEDNPETATNLTSPVQDRQADGLDASVAEELEAGTYYVAISGAGQGDPAENTPSNGSGYTGYGSLGNYTLAGTAEPFEAEPITITAPEDGAEVERSGLEVAGTAEAEASVTLTVGDDTVGQATAGGEGNWSTTLEGELPYGTSTITASQSVGSIDVPQTAEVSVVVPVDAPVIEKPEEGDTATTATPVFTGTGIPGAEVAVTIACGDDFGAEGTATVGEDGSWSFTPDEDLPSGECSVTAAQTINDTTSDETGPVGFTVDVASGDENGGENGDESGDENGDESGDAGGSEDGEDLPDTGAGSMNLIALAGGLVLLGLGGALYARTRRSVTES